MSDYQAQFDQHVANANSAVANHIVQLGDALTGLHPSHVRRLIANISRLLGFVDRKEAPHVEFLASTPRNVPERAIELISGVPSSFESGTAHFVQNVLPSLVEAERRLMEAAGAAAFKTEQIRNQQVRAIDKLLDNSNLAFDRAMSAAENAEEGAQGVNDALSKIRDILSTAELDSAKISETRKVAEKLSRGNAGQNPLEALVRLAREKGDEIKQLRDQIGLVEKSASKSAAEAEKNRDESGDILGSLTESNNRADEILRNVTQAGLAGAYKMERDKLAAEQNKFATAFYVIILFIIIYAVIFLLPVFQEIISEKKNTISNEDGALMLLVRLAVISPVVWALIFTSRRFRYLETLQMDYAAKATTALAYSGYSDEMDSDIELSKRLKDGLVMRFLEHPSRLLGKKEVVDWSSSGPEGVRVESKASTSKTPSDVLEIGDKSEV